MLYILLWWFIVQLFGLAALPIAYQLFRWLPDRGYAFAKALGLLFVSYLLWMGATTGVLTNSSGGIVLALLGTAAISAGVTWLGQKRGEAPSDMLKFWRSKKATILAVEVLFLLAFVAWAAVRAYTTFKIASAGGEKFMEMAFLNAILNSPRFPPLDPWMSGFSISYYYFGYVMMAILTRLSGAPVGVGFDLYDALLFALTAVGAFGVVYNLIAAAKHNAGEGGQAQPMRYGLLGMLLTLVMGNLEGLLESLHAAGKLSPSIIAWLNINDLTSNPSTGSFYPGASSWWWWHASRVVNDSSLSGEMLYTNITEFPLFSFLLGDNHPHVNNLPFVLLAIGLAFNLLRMVLQRSGENAAGGETAQAALPWWNPLAAFAGSWPRFLAYAFCLGALGFLNTWDFPIYIVVTVLAFGVGLYTLQPRLDGELVGRVAALMAALLVVGAALYTLFYVSFQSQAGGILPYVLPPTRMPHYLVMFAPFVFIALGFLITALARRAQDMPGVWRQTLLGWLGVIGISAGLFALLGGLALAVSSIRQTLQAQVENSVVQQALGGLTLNEAVPAILRARLTDPWVFLLLSALLTLAAACIHWNARQRENAADSPPAPAGLLFASLLLFCGVGLTLSVEFVFLRDVFNNRMNTMFKFYYQAWIMMACASAYALWWMREKGSTVTGKAIQYAFLGGASLLIAAGMVYPSMAIPAKTNNLNGQSIQVGPDQKIVFTPNLDGSSTIARENPDDWAAIEWLRANAGASHHGNAYGVPVILEAPGTNYDYNGRISTFTGYPALLGWAYHEHQWRGTYDEQGRREPIIETIYTTADSQEALQLLQEWKVDYVVVGQPEYNYIAAKCKTGRAACTPENVLRKFDAVLERVFQQGNMTLYRVP
ncbi:MAG: DUF2298 domain-containing protein [Chloroflexota bacterium]